MNALLLAALLAAPAEPSCGASACEMDSDAGRPRQERSARLGYEFEFVPQSRRWAGRGEAPSGVKGGHHDEVYSVTRLHRLTAALGLTRGWSVAAQLPFLSRSHGHVHHHGGRRLDDAWSVGGVGDLFLEGRYAFWRAEEGSTWSLGGGVELPTGRASAENAAGAGAEAGVLPGSRSFDVSASLLWQRPLGRAGLFASLARRFHGPGAYGYRLGDLSMAHAGATARVTRRWTAMLQLNAVVRGRDWKGSTREDTSNTGGEALYATPGFEFSPAANWTFSAAVQLPIYQRVNGYQIVADYSVRSGLGYRFSF